MRMGRLGWIAAYLAVALVVVAAAIAETAQPREDAAAKDPVLRAMTEELARSKSQLQLQNFERPFFIQYRLEDVEDYQASASYGAPVDERREHQRLVRVTVRVGDYAVDSSSPRGDGALQMASIDDDPVALRTALWSATDTAYKAALRDYTRKQAALKAYQTPPGTADFSREAPVVKLEPVARLQMNAAGWQRRIADASRVYQSNPEFEQETEVSSASVHGRVVNRYLVNTEGTIVRKGMSAYEAAVTVGTQADDGMRLERTYQSTGTSPEQLDSPEVFCRHAAELLATLDALRHAPLVDDEVYHGPVLFAGNASGRLFDELFVPGIEALPPELGTAARTRGPYASSYHARVLPSVFSVRDDPTTKVEAGQALLGAYDVDDEGVAAQPVTLVENGRLVNYLVGRAPVKDFPVSNGHGRAGIAGPPRPHTGVLRVEAREAVSAGEMNRRMRAMARDQGLDWVYEVKTMGPDLTPGLLYRVNAATGKEELVRGAAFDELDQRSLRSGIAAAGNDVSVLNFFGELPATILAPSVLFDDVTVKRASEKNEKLPYYPAPDGPAVLAQRRAAGTVLRASGGGI